MYEELKQRVWKANMQLPEFDLIILTWGNVSCIDREHGVIAIKPSGVPYETLCMEDIVITDLKGNIVDGTKKPSSDLMTHLALYQHFPDITSIVHTHSRWAVAWAQACRDIPVYGTTHADYFYGSIPCTDRMSIQHIQEHYEWNTGMEIVNTFKKRGLSLDQMNAVLVRGHGPFVWGTSCDKAVENALVLETIAEMAYHQECLVHKVCPPIEKELLDRHYKRKHGKDAYYGQ